MSEYFGTSTGHDSAQAMDSGARPRPGASDNPSDVPETVFPSSTSTNGGPSSSRATPRAQTRRKYYAPRQCRICFEQVQPTLRTRMENVPDFLQPGPEVIYADEDGRLLRPCKCKGSSKYVHEKCLSLWRHRDVHNARNYYHCPTCGFQYRIAKLGYAKMLSSPITRVAMTLLVFVVAAFILGFFAETIINVGLDPWAFVVDNYLWPDDHDGRYEQHRAREGSITWTEHFLNGFASMGVLGLLKVLFSMRWIDMLRVRTTRNARAGATGRDRFSTATWIAVFVGVIAVLAMVWKITHTWSSWALRRVEHTVLDVHDADDEDDEDDSQN